jgi:hypothetical protein
MEAKPINVATAIRHYEALLRAKKKYNERKKQEKIANGEYRPRGRPRKNIVDTPI